MPGERRTVTVMDHSSGKKYQVTLPANVPISRLRPALVKQLGLTATSQGGATQEYDLSLSPPGGQGEGVRLEDSGTLAGSGVQDGAVLRISPRMRAG